MGILKSFVNGKVDQIEAQRFESLREDLREDVKRFKSVVNECRETHSSIVNDENRKNISNWEELEFLPQKLEDMEERINSPLIKSLADERSFQDQIIESQEEQESWQRGIEAAGYGIFPPFLAFVEMNIQREKEREGDLRALASLFEGEEGFKQLTSDLGTVRELLLEVKTIQEDLDNTLENLQKLQAEDKDIDDLEELDDMGERWERLMLY